MNRPYKSVAVAILISIFFCSFGVLYASFWWGVVITILAIIVSGIPKVGAYVFFVVWVCCPFLSAYLVERHNKRLFSMYPIMK